MATELFPPIERDACISECGVYRWSLSRSWGDLLAPWVGWIMLNPSTADASIDDPTIRKCMGFARRWGYSGIAVRNIFALRSTSPTALYAHADPVGSVNDDAICDLIGVCPLIVAAWGVDGSICGRDRRVLKMLADRGVEVKCLGKTKDGFPKHPLYVPYETELVTA